jgi:hypothetical protein
VFCAQLNHSLLHALHCGVGSNLLSAQLCQATPDASCEGPSQRETTARWPVYLSSACCATRLVLSNRSTTEASAALSATTSCAGSRSWPAPAREGWKLA